MDLLLWRHAEAKEGTDPAADTDRELSRRGLQQARQMADWLRLQRLPTIKLLSSPAKRAVQTALTLGLPMQIRPQLGVGAGIADLLGAAEWPDHSGAIILVSHQPALGQLAALLLAGAPADWTIKKAGIWWFSNRVRHDETQTVLRAVHNP
ncbi:MAG: histidine phosphatase family protein [Burkholderiaceae bacterium]|nr:histidine phosphatase family protein [Sulfuritalea sp.]MCF8175462.1 histidine phosphatase family protein [Burkholderiaceae bacterium]MCF8184113.1 histidine phosphatase family protein [Polynucleobacter sp.]